MFSFTCLEHILELKFLLEKYQMKSIPMSRVLTPMLVAAIFLLPVQISLCQTVAAPESVPVELPAEKNKVAVDKTAGNATVPASTHKKDSSLSTGTWIGIGAGAVVLLGGAVALGSGGGSGSSGGSDPVVPPTAAQMVSAWQAVGEQPGSGRTYTGTYHLYDGGSIGYDLNVSSGEHLVGSGSWRTNGYQLEIHTDHGSLYSGSFSPGVYTIIHMNANTQWNLTLTR